MHPPEFDRQAILADNIVRLIPLKEDDFDTLYAVASDPLIWEQHPNKDRYQREVFQTFFQGAIESKGAYLIIHKETDKVIGSTRFYDTEEENAIAIGYTFYAREYWGGKYNPSAKKLMMDHALKYFGAVIFHIGSTNFRSQKAIERLGAKKIGEQSIAYYGEMAKQNFIYRIGKEGWM
ncbi:GNAT family N-acetyltransferase [Mucilaginibacter myungsuensis]|uniref:GNAT family N-acetyltransferase n=1 Tax=Mucilaginibacter myungsuensis TaxID=649104 RepID=A0A929L0A9_9SPHI|nr:GNAT family N-acetyltransferase [Mucilaginibacter myungsuensis]MBE9663880.1 GNAT family N-acetyltransferase [Mucilaginibacter myungsuensis]MDN3598404.1 GNAT family N-acetyltransferase [Mucilaginibacter myungsuensis]